MQEPRRYEAAIIGAGQAGVPLARTLARAGRRTALIERTHVGGSCVNEGCTPSKTLLASARVAAFATHALRYGILPGEVTVDMPLVQQRVRSLVARWREGTERSLTGLPHLDLFRAEARFVGPHRLRLEPTGDGESEADSGDDPFFLDADRIFVNVGCRPSLPELPGLEDVPFLTSTTILELDYVPEHLLILGGGYIAVEYGQAFHRFGSEVTLIQRSPTLLSREDEDVAEALGSLLLEDGLHLLLGTRAWAVRSTADGGVELTVSGPEGERTLLGSHLLVATGRTANTDTLEVEAAGLELDERGYLPADQRLQSRVPNIYVLGDAKGGPAFTHISYDDFRIIRANLLEGDQRTTADRPVPYVVFSDPQLGRIGPTEKEVRAADHPVDIYSLPMRGIGRAQEMDEARGFIKVIAEPGGGRILGCAVLGVEGGELMSLLQMAMMGGVTVARLRDAVFAHPTLAEGLNNLFTR